MAQGPAFEMAADAWNLPLHQLPCTGWRPQGECIDPELPLDQPMPCQLDLTAVQRQLSAQEFDVQVSSDPGRMQAGACVGWLTVMMA